MKEEFSDLSCGREADLLGYLYDELDAAEKDSFQSHMRDCLACSSELASLGGVRESVVAWRNQSLAGVTTAEASPAFMHTPEKRPSAIAAWREFFNLSPLWMKGAVAFASLLFCVLAVLAVVRWRETPAPEVVNNSRTYSEQEMKAIVDMRVQEEMQRIKASQPATTPIVAQEQTANRFSKRNANGSRAVTSASSTQKLRRPLSRVEREQLAADLRLTTGDTDSLELLSDRLSQ